MTIASEIQRIQGNISDAYNSCAIKGATMPVVQNSAYLADTINSITGGGGGTEDYDLGVGVYYVNNGVAMPQAGDVSDAFKSIVSIENYAMRNACRNFNIIGDVNFCNLINIGDGGLKEAFNNCIYLNGSANFCNLNSASTNAFNTAFKNTKIHSIDFSNLVSATNYCFLNAFRYTNLAEVNFPKLETTTSFMTEGSFRNAFANCENLHTINFPSLINASAYLFLDAFSSCYNLANIYFENMRSVYENSFGGTFKYCNSLQTVYFNSLQNIQYRSFVGAFNHSTLQNIYFPSIISGGVTDASFNGALQGVSGCTAHFPSSMQSIMENFTNVTSGMGGTNTTVLFDL